MDKNAGIIGNFAIFENTSPTAEDSGDSVTNHGRRRFSVANSFRNDHSAIYFRSVRPTYAGTTGGTWSSEDSPKDQPHSREDLSEDCEDFLQEFSCKSTKGAQRHTDGTTMIKNYIFR